MLYSLSKPSGRNIALYKHARNRGVVAEGGKGKLSKAWNEDQDFIKQNKKEKERTSSQRKTCYTQSTSKNNVQSNGYQEEKSIFDASMALSPHRIKQLHSCYSFFSRANTHPLTQFFPD